MRRKMVKLFAIVGVVAVGLVIGLSIDRSPGEEGFADRKRAVNKKLNIKKRTSGFPQIEYCLTEKDAVKEARNKKA